MTNKQIDELLQAFYEDDYTTIEILLTEMDQGDIMYFIESNGSNLSSGNLEKLLNRVFDINFKKRILQEAKYNLPIDVKMRLALKVYRIDQFLDELPWAVMLLNDGKRSITPENADYSVLDKTRREYREINLSELMTIGLEIESEGRASEDIKKYFSYLKWEAKADRSLIRGVEITSPILHATKQDSKQVFHVCDMMKNMGQEILDTCGGHIHIGADFLKSRQAWANFFEIYSNTEKILYAMVQEEGTAPRSGILKHAAPTAHKIKEALEDGVVNFNSEEDLDEFVKGLKEIQANDRYDEDFLPAEIVEQEKHSYDRYFGMNLCNLTNAKNTIEFRMPNGTLDPDLWIDNVNLLGGIVQISQELAEILMLKTLAADQYRKLTLFKKLKEKISDKEKAETLIELLGLEAQRYIKRFNANIELVEENKELCERVIDEPLVIKSKPVIVSLEFAMASDDVSALKEIEAMNQIVNHTREHQIEYTIVQR